MGQCPGMSLERKEAPRDLTSDVLRTRTLVHDAHGHARV